MIRDEAKYRKLEQLLGTKLTPARMAFLEERGYTHEIDHGNLSTVVKIAYEINEYRHAWGQVSTRKKKRRAGVARYTVHRASIERDSTSAWEEAVSVYLAHQAKQSHDVRAFRASILHEELLPEERVEYWLQQKYQEQGLPGLWLGNIPMSGHEYFSLLDAAAKAHQAQRNSDMLATRVSLSRELQISDLLRNTIPRILRCRAPGHRDKAAFLAYKFNHRVLHIYTAVESPLEELRTISVQLAAFYGWDEAEAALFVLTDRPPTVRRAACSIQVDPSTPARARVTLTIDPTMTVEEVAFRYRHVQGLVLGSRHRELSVKHIALAKWEIERSPEKTWSENMRDWNHAHPEWAYRHHANFARDCLRARDHLLNPKVHTPQAEAMPSEWLMTPSGFVPHNDMAAMIAMREALMLARQGGNEDSGAK